VEPSRCSQYKRKNSLLIHLHSQVFMRAWSSKVDWPGLASPVLVHERSRDLLLRHRPSVVVHFGLGLGRDLRGVVAVDGDAGVGAGFSGVAHDVGERGVGGRLELILLDGGEVILGLGGGWWRRLGSGGVGLRAGWLVGLVGQRDFIDGLR